MATLILIKFCLLLLRTATSLRLATPSQPSLGPLALESAHDSAIIMVESLELRMRQEAEDLADEQERVTKRAKLYQDMADQLQSTQDELEAKVEEYQARLQGAHPK